MVDNQSPKKSEQQFWLVMVSYVIGIVGILAALGNQDGTWLIASAVAFASLLHYYKNK